jgi:adenylate cyclase class 2
MLEIEIKFRVDDMEGMASALRRLGAKKRDEGLERNIVFDREGEFLKSGHLLRLRSYAGRADITHKRKIPAPPHSEEKFKVREEVVVNIDDFQRGKSLLEALGFRPVWSYEKNRQTWEHGGAGILLDTLPLMGNFMEIEGPREKIAEIVKMLGLKMEKGLKESYGDLFMEYCRSRGLPLGDMVFPTAAHGNPGKGEGR